jgi:hypothetical protein
MRAFFALGGDALAADAANFAGLVAGEICALRVSGDVVACGAVAGAGCLVFAHWEGSVDGKFKL